MAKLYHHPLDPQSRFIRLILAEHGVEPELEEERVFERRLEFLKLNPAGTVPVMVEETGAVVPGAGPIAEYLEETRGAAGKRLMPEDPADRVEVRRLVEWFNVKCTNEVTHWLVTEKVYKRFMSAAQGGGAPEMELVRAARANIRHHLRYIGYLASHRNFLAGDTLTYADLAAAAHISCVDFLGDVPWTEDEMAKSWYARIKSRPAFRGLLADRVPGITPAESYANLDF
ncbi:FtsZ-localized protein A [Beijerinckiaceae bacterium RH AL1]|jgi:glutathione S-transferase|nr:glutathione S-transferase family protein [Beijerinckiaceae bacterium]VVB46407.1 FtsZ-localized protein A [Beijerinckiaceae bacterium RH CH11]VVB46492.1 FtsZ-localized protein A [Beijerinckiaceae bacterium RH AL8]VVC55359.1 FtsZ-localized protein A [Beijerinckiaceae bacterium RH AL1]